MHAALNRTKYQMRLFAFTLAEVLITIGIIGIIATITIPMIATKVRNRTLKTQFQKSYSITSQAALQTKQELNSDNLQKDYATAIGSDYPYKEEFYDAFKKQLKLGDPIPNALTTMNYTNTDTAVFSLVSLQHWYNLPDGSSINYNINTNQISISVDTNGYNKKPNRAGYDVFCFNITSAGKVVPRPNTDLCTESSNEQYNGRGCSYYAFIDKNPDDETKGYWELLK